jgi:hypothetical protein
MRVGVVSDTHLPRFGRELPRELRDGLRAASVDLVLHLGDFTGPETVELFEAIAPFDAVAGNNDPPELVARFGRRKVVARSCRQRVRRGRGRRHPLRTQPHPAAPAPAGGTVAAEPGLADRSPTRTALFVGTDRDPDIGSGPARAAVLRRSSPLTAVGRPLGDQRWAEAAAASSSEGRRGREGSLAAAITGGSYPSRYSSRAYS